MKIPQGQGIVSNRQTAGAMSSSATSFAAGAGSAAMGLADQWMDQRAEAEAQEARNSYQKRMNELADNYRQREGKDALGSTAEFEKEAQKLNKDLTSNLGKRSLNKLGDFTTRVGEAYRMNIMGHERQQEKRAHAASFENGLTISQEMVRKDAKSWQVATEHLGQTMETGLKAGLWAPEEHESKKTELTNKFRSELGKSYYTQDRHEFIKNIDQFGFGKAEVAAYKDKYQKDLLAEQREKKSLFNEEAKLIYGQRDDMKAQAIANGNTDHFFQNADKLETMGYKDWASNLREEGKSYQDVVAFRMDNKGKTLAELHEARLALSVPENLQGSASKLKAIEAINKETDKEIKLFQADPAKYVGPLAVGFTEEERASSVLSLQKEQGITPKNGYQILDNDTKTAYKAAWETASSSERAEMLKDTFKYGKHTAQVLSEVGVNQSLALAPLFADDERALELLAVSADSKESPIVDDNQKTAYASDAKESEFYQGLLKVQSRFPTNPDLPVVLKDIEKTMVGISARKVDTAAGRNLFDEKIEFMESRDKLVYYPKTLDERDVEPLLDEQKKKLIEARMSGNALNDQSSRRALRDAVWVNSRTGFILADERTGEYFEGSEIPFTDVDVLLKDQNENRKRRIAAFNEQSKKTLRPPQG